MNEHIGKAEVFDEALGEIKFEAHCHVFRWLNNKPTGEFSWCGVPRLEQKGHPISPKFRTSEFPKTPYCAYCGLKRCQKCYEKMQ